MPRSTASARQTAPTRSAVKQRTISTDQLANDLASDLADLTISNAKGKQKALSEEDQRNSAMRAVNSASQTLSTVVQSGWRKSSKMPLPKASPTLTKVNASSLSAMKNLSILREISPGDLDVERAAMSILGKLVTLEMVRQVCISHSRPLITTHSTIPL